MGTTTARLGLVESERSKSLRWFSSQGCVEVGGGRVSVRVGGSLVAEYAEDDDGSRNVILVGLAADPRVHLGRLAAAFSLSSEALRVMRRLCESEGVAALVGRRRGGVRRMKVTPQRRAKIEAMFAAGRSINQVFSAIGGRWNLGRSTIGSVPPGTWIEP